MCECMWHIVDILFCSLFFLLSIYICFWCISVVIEASKILFVCWYFQFSLSEVYFWVLPQSLSKLNESSEHFDQIIWIRQINNNICQALHSFIYFFLLFFFENCLCLFPNNVRFILFLLLSPFFLRFSNFVNFWISFLFSSKYLICVFYLNKTPKWKSTMWNAFSKCYVIEMCVKKIP